MDRVFFIDQNGYLIGSQEHNPNDKTKYPRKKKKRLKKAGLYHTHLVGFAR